MKNRFLFASASLVAVAASALPYPAPKTGRTSDAAVWERLRGYWQEVPSNPPAGKELNPVEGISWEFYVRGDDGRDRAVCRTDWDNQAEQDKYGVRLNAAADPMWLDEYYADGDRAFVRPGIIKLDGDRLVWVRGPEVPAKAWDAARGRVPERPKGFDAARGVQRLVLQRMKL